MLFRRLVQSAVLPLMLSALSSTAGGSELALFSTIPWHMLAESTVVPHPIRSGWLEEMIDRGRETTLSEAIHQRGINTGIAPLRFEISKSQFVLIVYSGETPIKVYPVSLSGSPIGHKMRQGDKKTPEGIYSAAKHISPTYGLSYYVSYPSRGDALRGFLEGAITYMQFRRVEFAEEHSISPPSDTGLGGKILIHTAPRMRDSCVTCENWSMGCIVMEPDDLQELLATTPWFEPIRVNIYSVDIELMKDEVCMNVTGGG